MFRSHWSLVLGYLCRRADDPSLGEELAQETFYRATRAFLGYRGGNAGAWLLSIARNVLIDEARRGTRLQPLQETMLDVPAPSTQDMDDLLRLVPPNQSRLLRLIYVDGFTHAEVAAMTRSTAKAVKTAVYRARQILRDRYLEGQTDE